MHVDLIVPKQIQFLDFFSFLNSGVLGLICLLRKMNRKPNQSLDYICYPSCVPFFLSIDQNLPYIQSH